MIRLSAALTRRATGAVAGAAAGGVAGADAGAVAGAAAGDAALLSLSFDAVNVRTTAAGERAAEREGERVCEKRVCFRGEWATSRFAVKESLFVTGNVGLTSSSQVSISFPMLGLCEQ